MQESAGFPAILLSNDMRGCGCFDIHDRLNLIAVEPMDVEELLDMGLDDLHDDHADDHSWMATDDLTGDKLDPKLIVAARREDM